MQLAYLISVLLSAAAFFFYGLSCLFADAMVAEFERFGLARFRRLTGALEVLGAIGLAAGLFHRPFAVAASAGLTLLMILGVGTRVRVRDSPLETLPALVLLLVNAFIFFYALTA